MHRLMFLCTCLFAGLVLASTVQLSTMDVSSQKQARLLQEQTIDDLFAKFMDQLEFLQTSNTSPPNQVSFLV